MKKPRICAVIVNNDLETVKAIEPFVDLFEVRIDLIGAGWQELVKQFKKPWIGCNRSTDEGGRGEEDEASRVEQLLEATELGADIIDLEFRMTNLKQVVELIKKKTKCLLSFHELERTPPIESMRGIVQRQLEAGADVCKIVTTAQRFEDNLVILQLLSEFSKTRIVSLAMGPLGFASRVLCPLAGGDLPTPQLSKEKNPPLVK